MAATGRAIRCAAITRADAVQSYLQLRVMRVSDDDYWKDFPGEVKSLTPRLLQTDLLVTRPFGDWSAYARALKWQVLQTGDPTTRIDPPPYERAPQVGARYAGPWRRGLDVAFEGSSTVRIPQHYRSRAEGSARMQSPHPQPYFSTGWTVTPSCLSKRVVSVHLTLATAASATRLTRRERRQRRAIERDTTFCGEP